MEESILKVHHILIFSKIYTWCTHNFKGMCVDQGRATYYPFAIPGRISVFTVCLIIAHCFSTVLLVVSGPNTHTAERRLRYQVRLDVSFIIFYLFSRINRPKRHKCIQYGRAFIIIPQWIFIIFASIQSVGK